MPKYIFNFKDLKKKYIIIYNPVYANTELWAQAQNILKNNEI